MLDHWETYALYNSESLLRNPSQSQSMHSDRHPRMTPSKDGAILAGDRWGHSTHVHPCHPDRVEPRTASFEFQAQSILDRLEFFPACRGGRVRGVVAACRAWSTRHSILLVDRVRQGSRGRGARSSSLRKVRVEGRGGMRATSLVEWRRSLSGTTPAESAC